MSTKANEVVVHELYKAYGSQPVLRDLDLEVPAGGVTAVLGPSGSGKTTLLRVLAGFERPDSGSVRIGGVVVDDGAEHVSAEHRRIGYVSQEGSLFPHLTVEANVGFGLARRHRRGRRVGELLEAVGLSSLSRRYPHQLSGGQQQRVALARALAVKPGVVLLDEPFASLDANMRANVRADVNAILREAGTTAVLVTHDQDEALSIADFVAVIRDGRIAQVASPHDLYANPLDAEVARFVGDANLVEGVAGEGVVVTALGSFAVVDGRRMPRGEQLTVLVRPEQVEVHAGAEAGGVPGRVLSTEFYGHDAIVRVLPDVAGGTLPIFARVLGGVRLEPGSKVTLRVRGPVGAWPCAAGRHRRGRRRPDDSRADAGR